MGFQERDYYKDDERTSYVTSLTVKLIIVNCVVFLANLLFGGREDVVSSFLAMRGDTIAHPERWWQFLTYGFVHDPRNLWHLVGNMLGLYFFGKPLEERYGWKEFLRFYLLAIVLGGIVWGARVYFGSPPGSAIVNGKTELFWPTLSGASGGTTAAIILFCLLYPHRTVLLFLFLPAPAWVLGLIIVAGDMFGVGRETTAFDVHLTGAVLALGYWYFGWNFGRLPGMAGLGKSFKSLGRSMRPKPDLRVHDPETTYEDEDAEADRVLAKLKAVGESSLTSRERRILEAYSRRMRQKLR
jgi:membrane associated rhomboid family serine protease